VLFTLTLALGLTSAAAEAPACRAPAPGMRCVPGGKIAVAQGAARRVVHVAPFFVDERPLSKAELAQCRAAGACEEEAPGKVQPPARAEESPATMPWTVAEAACAYFGKRLPSEAEWQAAFEGAPQGEALPEWTHTWEAPAGACDKPLALLEEASRLEAVPPALCGSQDPLDPCDGAFPCGTLTRKIMKARASPRARTAAGWGGPRTAASRCVTARPFLTRFPSTSTTVKRPRPPTPKAPSAEEVATFGAITEDELDTPLCEKVGRSFVDCRDPRSYLKTNEPLQQVVAPYIENLGGGYTGVGADQNYTFVALARAQWAWIFDYDPNVVTWHRILRAFILEAPTRSDFVELFRADNVEKGVRILKSAAANARDGRVLEHLYRSSAKKMLPHYEEERTSPARAFTWLGTDESYATIRALYAQGRMRAFRGNMLDVHTMRGIAAAARKLGVPIRVYYPSNAPEFWIFTDAYRENVRALPFDDTSVVVQTISSMKSGFGQEGYWHYNVQHGLEHQRLLGLGGYTRLRQLFFHRTKTDSGELTLSGMPSTPAAGP
jgi:hypothetical protein